MSLSTLLKKQLNRTTEPLEKIKFGNLMDGLVGATGSLVINTHTVTSAEASASRVVITTGLPTVSTFWSSYIRSGSPIAPTFVSGSVAGTLVVSANSSASPLAGDVASFIAI